jgi:YVTN family beta-propeller protein
MQEKPVGRIRGFLRTGPGQGLLVTLVAGATLGAFLVDIILAIPTIIILGLGLPIYVGLKRPRFLALLGIVVLLAVAPLTCLVYTQDLRAPLPPLSAPASVPSAAGPVALAVDPSTGTVYAADFAANTVTAINTSTGAQVGSFGVGSLPIALALAGGGTRLYVLDFGSAAVSVLNLSTGTLSATVPVGSSPVALAVDPTAAKLFVANFGSGNVTVLSTTTEKVVANVTTGSRPDAVVVDPANGEVYVADRGSGTVDAIYASNDTLARSIAVGASPRGLALNASGAALAVTNTGGGSVSVVATATDTVSSTVSVGKAPIAVVAGASAAEVYVANSNSTNLSVVSMATGVLVQSVTLPGAPGALAYDNATGDLYVADLPGASVVVLDTAGWATLANVSVGGISAAIAVDPGAARAVVAAYSAQTIVLIRTANYTVAATTDDGTNGGLLQNASVSPYLGSSSTEFVYRLSVYPGYVPEGTGQVLKINFYVSTCPGATAPNNVSSCPSNYPLFEQSIVLAQPVTTLTTVTGKVAGLGTGVWTWAVTATLSNVSLVPSVVAGPNVTYLMGTSNSSLAVITGPVVGTFLDTYSEILFDIFLTDLVYLGIPFYFVLLLYMWFKARERRRKQLTRRAAAEKAAGTGLASTSPAQAPGGPPGQGGGSGGTSSGTPAPPELTCPSCGAVVYAGEAKCWKCGGALNTGPASAAGAALPSRPP